MADISKIKLANGTTVLLKDAQGRADMTTLLGTHALGALGAAAWEAVAAEVKEGATGLPTAAAVKSYVDSMIETIPEFDVVVVADGEDLPVASADTFHKIYLKKAEGSAVGNVYVEYITIRNGSEGAYTYSWEKVRDTAIDISGKVDKTQKIAGIALSDNITVAQLQEALGLKALAYKDNATGSTTLNTIDSITMKEMTVAGNATVTLADVDATLTKVDYTPAGSIKIGENVSDVDHKVLTGGDINVTLKEGTEAKKAIISNNTTYSPAGEVKAKAENGSFSAIKSVALEANDQGNIQIQGSVAEQTVSLTSASKTFVTGLTDGTKKAATLTNGAFTPAAFQDGFYTAGSAATWTGAAYTAPTLGEASKSAFASEGVTAAIDADDAECLTFTTAATSDALTAQGTFSAGNVDFGTFSGGSATVIDTTKFSGGSKVDDTLTAEYIPTVTTDTVNDVTAAKLAGFNFASDKYSLNTTSDTALKDVEFTATNSATIPSEITYKQSEIDAATFTGTSATLSFSGTTVNEALVTEVSYKKANETAAFSVAVTPETSALNKTAKTIEITVE